MRILAIICCGIVLLGALTMVASEHDDRLGRLKQGIADPGFYLKELGPLVVMGNAPVSSAKIIFLPEVHDDPESLTTQFLLIAREKQKEVPFIVLDESLETMKKSMWDIFSQKSLEILAAYDQRQEKEKYAPQKFEMALQKLANKFRSVPGHLNFLEREKMWALSDFSASATPFFGWDLGRKGSLVERNFNMVDSLKSALQHNEKILIMAGARHVPELEFLTSRKLLCKAHQVPDIDSYFTLIEKKFGAKPQLQNGIGATAPIYDFLKNQSYAVVFSRGLYKELDRIVEQFKAPMGPSRCLNL